MKSSIDLWPLRVFLAVCETGSMTDAARKLKLTQPAVSRIIRQLDEAVGLPVMDRDLSPIRWLADSASGSSISGRSCSAPRVRLE